VQHQLEPRRVPLGRALHVLQQLTRLRPPPISDLVWVGAGRAVELPDQDVVELVLGQAAGGVFGGGNMNWYPASTRKHSRMARKTRFSMDDKNLRREAPGEGQGRNPAGREDGTEQSDEWRA